MSQNLKAFIKKAMIVSLVASPVVVMLVVVYISHRLGDRFERETVAIHALEAKHVRLSQQQLDEMQAEMDR